MRLPGYVPLSLLHLAELQSARCPEWGLTTARAASPQNSLTGRTQVGFKAVGVQVGGPMEGWVGVKERNLGGECENSGWEVTAGKKGMYPQAAAGGWGFPAPAMHCAFCRGPAVKGQNGG